jgi:HEPN domain-containing protein
MQLAAKIRNARTSLSDRRTVRLAQRKLTDELATFASASDRAELDDILDRYPTEETREIREILRRQDAERFTAATVGSRRR